MKNCLRNHYFVAFFVTLTISIGLIIGGFFMPPQGEVDGSVLKGVGELFLWPALAFAAKALDDNKKIQIQQGQTTITVGAHTPPPPNEDEDESDGAEADMQIGEEDE
jgi:hypothetical protein